MLKTDLRIKISYFAAETFLPVSHGFVVEIPF